MADPAIRRSDATPGGVLVVGGALQGVAAVLMILVAVQFLVWWDLSLVAKVAAWMQLITGCAGLLLARAVVDGRPWAAMAATALAPVLTLISTVWAGWWLWNLSFTLFMVLTPPVAFVAMVLAPFTIRPALRCAAARKVVNGEIESAGMFSGVG